MLHDRWHMTHDTWHMTHDTWHMTHSVGWTFCKNFSSLALWCLFLFESGLKPPKKKADFTLQNKFLHISRLFWVFAFLIIFSVYEEKNKVVGYSWSTLLWYWCYYPHWSIDALSPVCGIFFLLSLKTRQVQSISRCVFLSPPPFTRVSTHCDCPATVHLIYTMENCSCQLKNSLIMPKYEKFIIFFLKVPIHGFGPGAFTPSNICLTHLIILYWLQMKE